MEFDAVNENINQDEMEYPCLGQRKPIADIFIDDRSVIFVDDRLAKYSGENERLIAGSSLDWLMFYRYEGN